MMKQTNLQRIGSLVLMTIALTFIADIQVSAQKKDYKPGEKIEYVVGGSYPEQWEEGTFVKATPDGTQPIIREKPNEFNKGGFQMATQWAKIRPLSAKSVDQATVNDTEADNSKTASAVTTDFGTGLMTQEQILSFLQVKLGDKPYAPGSVEIKKELAEMIKQRGLDFRYSDTPDFYYKIAKLGANTGELNFPLMYNYGEPTKEKELMGAWNLGKIGAAVDYVKNNRVYRQGETGVANVGTLTLNANGTYIWKVGAKDSTSGKWRKATSKEMTSEGGDGIVLLKAKGEYDWLVTKDRRTKNKGQWIGISELNIRQINEYGSRGTK